MPSIRIRITDGARGGFLRLPKLSVGVAAKQRLLELIETAIKPQRINGSDVSVSMTVWLSSPEATRVGGLMQQAGFDNEGEYITALLHAGALAYDREHPPTADEVAAVTATAAARTLLDDINAALGNATRPEQSQFHGNLRHFLTDEHTPDHGVLFAEASTGVGKTRAYLATVIEWAQQHPESYAVLAYPTIANMEQAVGEWNALQPHCALPPHTVLGSQDAFVSDTALREVLTSPTFAQDKATPEEEEAMRRAHAWLSAGAPADPEHAFDHPFTVAGFNYATKDGWPWPQEIRLENRSDDADAGMLAYRAQFKYDIKEGEGKVVRVVFCTHAMLAVHVREKLKGAVQNAKSADGDATFANRAKEYFGRDKDEREQSFQHENADYLNDHLGAETGRLPPIGLLLVDEAHALETSFASVFSYGFSLWKVKEHLRALKHDQGHPDVLVKDIDTVNNVFHALQRIGAASTEGALALSGDSAARSHIVALTAALADFKQRASKRRDAAKKPGGSAAGRAVLRMLSALQLALKISPDANFGSIGEVEWSPSRQYPRINVGRYSVERELAFLWQSLAHRSILVSGTLYDFGTDNSPEALRHVLGVQREILCTAPPVRPMWVYAPVTLYLPARGARLDGGVRFATPDTKSDRERFYKPTSRDTKSGMDEAKRVRLEEEWAGEIANYLVQVHATAAGGTLVLARSYADLEAWRARMEPRIGSNLIVQRAHHRLADDKQEYLRLIAAGQKPVLLALGAAWTGLDLSTKPEPAPELDNTLTDLVIPLAPFGVNRTLTHRYRREKRGAYVEAVAATIVFRQGIGRLVRRPGIHANRRLHFLDARMHDINWHSFLLPLLRVLRVYHRRIEV